jgi:uncharacterized membrane protein
VIPSGHHLQHHWRFYVSAAAGIAIWILAYRLDAAFRTALAGNCFFLPYLVLTYLKMERVTPDDLRRHARLEDEGIGLIIVITLAAVAISLGSFALVLHNESAGAWHLVVAIATVPLGWCTLHSVLAFHYAHLFYTESDAPEAESRDAGGLEFPGERSAPTLIDFLYFSFVVGMTAQTSDVDITTAGMRKAALFHGVVSFFFNTVILALAVNVALTRN